MSMIGNLAVLSQEQLNELLKDPESIEQVLYADYEAEPSIQQLNIDKAWHVLHFLFTGTKWEGDFPAGFLVSCGETIGDVDVGYGPARWFNHDQVEKISDYLQLLDDQKLREQFIPKMLLENDIYPSHWFNCDVDSEWNYCHGFLSSMRAFLLDAKMKCMTLLVYIN